MLLHCNHCKKKFTLVDDEYNLEGKLIKCKHCQEEWIFESQSQYLENRLAELDEDLSRTEKNLDETNIDHVEKIEILEKNLKAKKEEFDKQKVLEDRIGAFEKRITNTEKANIEQAELEIKIAAMEGEIEKTSDDIFIKNKDIEKKTNYLEMKITSYNEDEKRKEKNLGNNNNDDGDVVDFKTFDQDDKDNPETIKKDKDGKTRYFWPNFVKK
jgi:predicted Zn finger-like uncharacterized protein|tara:strand:- start:1156 stop:1794 length:639 start_codon:yes stop_codon:yes gene_type:complete